MHPMLARRRRGSWVTRVISGAILLFYRFCQDIGGLSLLEAAGAGEVRVTPVFAASSTRAS